ncbi:hypothetical protein FJZ28_01755 [Candidatus Peregrinibacteria bacterium]|nr:hypothetical protein [Candidatus Peregrinibacteria bacterium]
MIRYTYQNRDSHSFSDREKRLIFEMASTPEAQSKPAQTQETVDPQKKENDIKAALGLTDVKVVNAVSKAKELPAEFQKQLKDNIAQFCRVSYDQYAKKDNKAEMSSQEHAEWQVNLMQKVDEILAGIVGGADSAKKNQEEKERKIGTLDEQLNRLPAQLQKLEHTDLDLDTEALSHPETLTPDVLQKELQKYEERSGRIQKQREAMSNKAVELGDIQKAYAAEVHTNNLAIGSAALGVGTIVFAAASTSWVPGLNLVTAGAAAVAIAAAAAAKAAMRARELERAKMANAKIDAFKQQYDAQRQELGKAVGDMRQDGDLLNSAPTAFRHETENKHKSTQEQLSAGAQTLSENRADARLRLQQTQEQLAGIRDQKTAVNLQNNQLAQAKQNAESKQQTITVGEMKLKDKMGTIDAAIRQLESNGQQSDQTAQEKIEDLKRMRTRMEEGSAAMAAGGEDLEKFFSAYPQATDDISRRQLLLEQTEQALGQTTGTLSDAEATLTEQLKQIQESSGLVDKEATATLDAVAGIEKAVTEGVGRIAVDNIKAQGGVEMEWASIKDMKVETPAFATSLAEAVAAPFEGVFKGIGNALSYASKEVPVLNLPGISHTLRFVGGVSEAAADITGGIAKMVVLLPAALGGNKEGIQMAKGLGNLLLVGTTEGSREAWSGMGKAIVAADLWSTDGAKAAGKALTNIALFFIPGAGEAGAAGRLASVAGKGILGRTAARASGLVRGTAESYLGAIKSIPSIPGAAVRLAKRPFTTTSVRLGEQATALTSKAAGAESALGRAGITNADEIATIANMSDEALAARFNLSKTSSTTDINAALRARNLAKQCIDSRAGAAAAEQGANTARTAEAEAAAAKAAKKAGKPAEAGAEVAAKPATGANAETVAGAADETAAAGSKKLAEGAVEKRAGPGEGAGTNTKPTEAGVAAPDGRGKISGAVDEGLDKFLKQKDRRVRQKDVRNEIRETDELLKSKTITEGERVQLQQQRLQLERLDDSITQIQKLRDELQGAGITKSDKLSRFLKRRSNTINRTEIAKEIEYCQELIKNPALDDAGRLRLQGDIDKLTRLYGYVDNVQVARGFASKPLKVSVSVPEGAAAKAATATEGAAGSGAAAGPKPPTQPTTVLKPGPVATPTGPKQPGLIGRQLERGRKVVTSTYEYLTSPFRTGFSKVKEWWNKPGTPKKQPPTQPTTVLKPGPVATPTGPKQPGFIGRQLERFRAYRARRLEARRVAQESADAARELEAQAVADGIKNLPETEARLALEKQAKQAEIAANNEALAQQFADIGPVRPTRVATPAKGPGFFGKLRQNVSEFFERRAQARRDYDARMAKGTETISNLPKFSAAADEIGTATGPGYIGRGVERVRGFLGRAGEGIRGFFRRSAEGARTLVREAGATTEIGATEIFTKSRGYVRIDSIEQAVQNCNQFQAYRILDDLNGFLEQTVQMPRSPLRARIVEIRNEAVLRSRNVQTGGRAYLESKGQPCTVLDVTADGTRIRLQTPSGKVITAGAEEVFDTTVMTRQAQARAAAKPQQAPKPAQQASESVAARPAVAAEAPAAVPDIVEATGALKKMTNGELQAQYKKVNNPEVELDMRYTLDDQGYAAFQRAKQNTIAEVNRRVQAGTMSEGRVLSQAGREAANTVAAPADRPLGEFTNDAARLEEARHVVNGDVPLTPYQRDAILRSHRVGEGEMGLNGDKAYIGNYTPEQIARKTRILREPRARFTSRQRRQLMESGITGAPAPSGTPPPPSIWKAGERLQGRAITTVEGRTLPATTDFRVLGPGKKPGTVTLEVRNYGNNPIEFVDVDVVQLNSIPKPKRPPPASGKAA